MRSCNSRKYGVVTQFVVSFAYACTFECPGFARTSRLRRFFGTKAFNKMLN